MEYKQSNDLQEPFGRPVDVRTAYELATALDEYNAWRRGNDADHPNPSAIGLLMDAAAEKLRSLEHQVSNTPSGMSFSHFGGNKYLKLRSEGYQNAGVAMHRTEPDGRVTRVWVGVHGMILWPRTECEAGVERAEKADLEREVKHWKANHATEVRRARILKERTDMPMERTAAYEQWGNDLAELERLKSLRFPQSLRKMWSGSEVQRWLEENLK